MHGLTKVFISGALGSLVAAWADPKIVAKLPASMQSGGVSKVVHATIAGGSAALAYWALGHVTGHHG